VEPHEMVTRNADDTGSEWAVPRVTDRMLNLMGIPDHQRTGFIEAYGQDIRSLTPDDFISEAEEE
jgi:hypothetical protein